MKLWYDKAILNPQDSDAGVMPGVGPARGVIHTIESPWVYHGEPYYHGVLKDLGSIVYIEQFRPFNVAALSLRNASGGIETNRRGLFNVQWAIAGYSKDSAGISDHMVTAIAEIMAMHHEHHGIPLVGPAKVCGGEAYGTGGACRMTFTEWDSYNGWCGHQHVPENTHWDPGKLPWARIITEAKQIAGEDDMAILTDEAQAFLQAEYEQKLKAKGADGEDKPMSTTTVKHVVEVMRRLADGFDLGLADEAEWESFGEAIVAKLGEAPPSGGISEGDAVFAVAQKLLS